MVDQTIPKNTDRSVTKSVTVNIPQVVNDQLIEIAQEELTSKASVIRKILKKAVTEKTKLRRGK